MLKVKKTLKKFGYDPTKLSKGSNKSCLCSCDYCGDIVEKKYFKWLKSRKYVQKDSCNKQKCRLSKQEANNLVRRGVKHHSQTQEYKTKFKKTCMERYGVENPFASKTVQEKIKKTVTEKYGVDNPGKSKIIKKKSLNTMKERYGVEYPYQSEKILKKIEESNLKKFGVRHYGEIQKIDFSTILKLCKEKKYNALFSCEDYINRNQKLDFSCDKHNIQFRSTILAMQNNDNQCPKCRVYKRSKAEIEIFDYVESLGVDAKHSDRTILKPDEVDIYISEKKVAIEYNGLYWHSELFKEKKYHFKKFNRCKQQGVTLIQIFQDEWINNPAVCKSLIQNKLGACQNKLFARKLDVVDSDCLDEKRFSQFFEENHLQANTRFQQAFGLTNDAGDIVFAISLRRPFTKSKRGCVEIARVATRKDTVVVGGFSRLMKRVVAWAKDREFEKILTYSDCRYSQGDVYEKYGFSFCGHTGVGYDYTDFTQRLNRFKFRAQKPKTEKQVAEENGVSRIYNAGNYRWELTL